MNYYNENKTFVPWASHGVSPITTARSVEGFFNNFKAARKISKIINERLLRKRKLEDINLDMVLIFSHLSMLNLFDSQQDH